VISPHLRKGCVDLKYGDHLIFYRTATPKDTWAKVQKKQ
jgi:hypothetical protein